MKAGRPTKMTPETVKKLEEAFLIGCSDLEACLVADISKQTLYTYQSNNPSFIDRKEKLKKNPTYLARKCVVEACEENPDLALKYLERKNKKEFSLRQENINADVTKDEFEDMTDAEVTAENDAMIRELGYVKEDE